MNIQFFSTAALYRLNAPKCKKSGERPPRLRKNPVLHSPFHVRTDTHVLLYLGKKECLKSEEMYMLFKYFKMLHFDKTKQKLIM